MDILDLRPQGQADYKTTWALQRELHAAVVAGTAPDTLVLVEHASVYTAGKRTASWDRPQDGTEVIDVDRGGKITWHGPGQLVVYPIVRLAEPIDVIAYVRSLETAVIEVCEGFGLAPMRVEDRSGVWLPADTHRLERKICAIGVRVAKGVTMHGIALNCTPDLDEFSRIVPCGITDAGVTSLSEELGRFVSIDEAVPATVAALERVLAPLRLSETVPTTPLEVV